MILGNSKGLSMSFVVDVDKKTVHLFDKIRKSEGRLMRVTEDNDMISDTVFFDNGTIASTSQGKIIHVLKKLEMVVKHAEQTN